jgi:hypothetical protein
MGPGRSSCFGQEWGPAALAHASGRRQNWQTVLMMLACRERANGRECVARCCCCALTPPPPTWPPGHRPAQTSRPHSAHERLVNDRPFESPGRPSGIGGRRGSFNASGGWRDNSRAARLTNSPRTAHSAGRRDQPGEWGRRSSLMTSRQRARPPPRRGGGGARSSRLSPACGTIIVPRKQP